DTAVRDDDDGIKDVLIQVITQLGQPGRSPGERPGLAGAGGVLNQVVLARGVLLGMLQDAPDRIDLMEPWKDQPAIIDLGKVANDVEQDFTREDRRLVIDRPIEISSLELVLYRTVA